VRRLVLIALLATLVGVAGCGGEETVMPTAETVEGQPPPPPAQAKGDPAKGKVVFEQSGCGGCHTFKPAGSTGKTGPDLDKLPEFAKTAGKPLDEFVHESIVNPDAYVEKGFPSGVMPPWSGDEQQLADLVAFLTQS
jgi:mono/diheme cytochrome c family protein